METAPIPCSVLILTRNSAATLPRCLETLGAFGEILLHDGNSEDDTIEIARRFGAKVLKQYDTEEKSVRVKDFTEIRLKQRADARYDWVLYVDSDEQLSREAVEEIRNILSHADPKTIIKIPRVPVIDGKPRFHADIFKEVMPRIHNRTSGAGFKKGKTVHEKYEYDSSFTEIALRSPLFVPLPNVGELRGKDDRYITLEVERLHRDGYSWGRYVRWILLREPLVMVALLLRIARTLPAYAVYGDCVPVDHNLRYVRYHWRLFRAFTGFMLGAR